MTKTGTRIEFRNVSKVFKTKDREVTAVDDVTLTVEPGEILGVIGYSGAGKSTLVRLINGLDMPTSGQLLLDGTDVVGMPERKLREIRRNVGMIFQQFNLFSSRTAAGNIEYPLKLAGVDKKERERRVAELLDFVGLGERGENYPEQLSGGQKQRVGIARALMGEPDLLLADEPTASLDADRSQEIVTLLRQLTEDRGIACGFVTHDRSLITGRDEVFELGVNAPAYA